MIEQVHVHTSPIRDLSGVDHILVNSDFRLKPPPMQAQLLKMCM